MILQRLSQVGFRGKLLGLVGLGIFALALTEAELEPDPIFEGKICDRCMLCAKHCSTGAISTTETVKTIVAGHELEWGKLNPLACEKGIQGGFNGERNQIGRAHV